MMSLKWKGGYRNAVHPPPCGMQCEYGVMGYTRASPRSQLVEIHST